MGLAERQFGSATVAAFFEDGAIIANALRFEAALARAMAEAGMMPAASAEAIEAAAGEAFDAASIGDRARLAGTYAIPLVADLTQAVRAISPEAAAFVHFGATSQDVIDTATALSLRGAQRHLDAVLARAVAAAADLAAKHRGTVMLGRTLMQPAVPITFGLKAAQWLTALADDRARLAAAAEAAIRLEFGGAAGTLAPFGAGGPDLAERIGAILGLRVPQLPWHSRRGASAGYAAALGILAGTLAKIGGDIAAMMQAEVAEAFEPAGVGRGGSSAMPHKRNPVAAMIARQMAARAPGLVATMLAAVPNLHERGLGGWQAEASALPELAIGVGGALEAIAEALEGLTVDAAAMRRNLEAMRGLIFTERLAGALAPHLGRDGAKAHVEALAKQVTAEGRDLHALAREDSRIAGILSLDRLKSLFNAAEALGAADIFIGRALERAEEERGHGR